MIETKHNLEDAVLIPREQIYVPWEWNMRGKIIPYTCLELAKDIDRNGLLIPILVVPYFNSVYPEYKYKLIVGFRRMTCFILNKDDMIPCQILENLSEVEEMKYNARENLQRQDLNIKQEAQGMQHFLDLNMSRKEIALELNKSEVWVDVRLKLLDLPEEVQDLAANGFLTQENINTLAKMKTTEQILNSIRILKEAKEKGEEKIELGPKKPVNTSKPKARKPAEINNLIELFFTLFESKGIGLWTVCLAWAAGNISDDELFENIKKFGDSIEIKVYLTPERWHDND